MKKSIYFFIILIGITICFTTGCIKYDKMDDINIITSIYPIEYVTNRLYGSRAKITSIYPNGANIYEYSFTEKQLKDFSKSDLFIFNGDSKEKDYAKEMIEENSNLKIIDASYGVDTSVSKKDVWLNPANMLMVAKNIKDELQNYITSNYINEEINNNYSDLKVDITELEASFKLAADNSKNKTIISYDESLKFLEKYGFTVINLTKNGENVEKNISLAKENYKNKNLSYLFITEKQEDTDLIKEITDSFEVTKATYRSIETISKEDVTNKKDYITLVKSNIELIKQETYQ